MKRSKKLARIIAPALLLSITAAACGSSSSASSTNAQSSGTSKSGPIQIADIQPLTGPSGQYGTQAVEGAKIAVSLINQSGGVLGRKLKLITADDASVASQSVSLMQKYGPDSSVSAIIGPTFSSDFIADAPFAQKYGVVTISSGSTAPWPGKFNAWTFRSSVPGNDYLPRLVSAVVAQAHVKTVAQIWAIDNQALAEQGKLLNSEFPKHGVKVLKDETATNSTTDFSSQVTAIMQNPPQLVTIGLITNGAELFTEQMRAAGYKGLFMADGNTLLDPSLSSGSNGAANGLIVPSSFNAASSRPIVKDFVKAFQAKYGSVPNAQEAFGYDAVLLIKHAVDVAKSTNRLAIRKVLGSTKDFQGVQGSFTFDGSGDNTTPSVHILQLTSSGFVPYPASSK